MKEQLKIEKFENEERMLQQYELFMKLMKKFDERGVFPWSSLIDEAEGDQELKVRVRAGVRG